MFEVLTNLGIISQYQDTNIEALEDAITIAEKYAAQGYTVEIAEVETGETIKLYNADDDDE